MAQILLFSQALREHRYIFLSRGGTPAVTFSIYRTAYY